MADTFLAIHECIQNQALPVDVGLYVVTAITPDGESPFCAAFQNGYATVDRPIIFPTPALDCVDYFLIDTTITRSNFTWAEYPGALGYNVYTSTLATPEVFSLLRENIPLSTLEIADQNIVVTAITPDGETPKCAAITFESSCPEAQDFLDRVALNGGIEPPIEEQIAVCDFITGMKNASLWDRMAAVIYFSPNGRETALTWLKKGPMSDTWVWDNPSLESNQIFSINGFVPRTYSDSSVPVNVLFTNVNSAGVSGYAADASLPAGTDVQGAFCGGRNANLADGAFALHPWKAYSPDPAFGLTQGWLWKFGSNLMEFNGAPLQALQQSHKGGGFVSMNRIAFDTASVYYAASDSPVVAVASSPTPVAEIIPSGNLRFFEDTVQSNQYDGYCSFLAFHDGLTQGEVETFFNLVQAFRMAIGGGYV